MLATYAVEESSGALGVKVAVSPSGVKVTVPATVAFVDRRLRKNVELVIVNRSMRLLNCT